MKKLSKERVLQVAAERPVGYAQEIAAAATREDSQYYYLTDSQYAHLFEKYRGEAYKPTGIAVSDPAVEKRSRLIKWISRFRVPEDRGLGDTLERMLSKVGGRKFKHLMQLMHMPCGCEDRRKWLNERFPFN